MCRPILMAATIVVLAASMAQAEDVTPEQIAHCRDRWENFLDRIPDDASESAIEEFFEGHFREKGTIPLGGSGARVLIYRIDDFTEITFWLEGPEGILIGQPLVGDTRQWLRYPDGTISTDLSP